jgi:uncharacterized protein YggL (DUF469 family)
MRKRVRKELRLAEFQEFGVALRFRLDSALSRDEVERFADSFLLEAIEGHGLVCGGGCGREWDLFVTRARRGSVTPEHVAAVRAWLERNHSVRDVSVGEPQDAWHSV